MGTPRAVRSIVVVVLILCVSLTGCSGGEGPNTAATGATGTGSDVERDRSSTSLSTTESPVGVDESSATEGEPTLPTDGSSRPALVTRVIDGDTVEVRYRTGESDTIRLLGVDTPEVSGDVNPEEFEGIPDSETGRDHLREWATRASSFARERLDGREVRVVTDPRADRRDRYGRLLAYVVPRGEGEGGSFNAALLREGYARVYESTFTERERYERIERRAREQGIGLWGFADAGETGTEAGAENGSSGTSRLAIVHIEADAPGDDNENPNGEYVILENRGPESLDIGGWQVTDEGGHTYVLPEGTRLAPGARLILYSGRGVDTGRELYWGSTGAIWNNGGDTVTVRDASETVVVRRSYGT